VKQTRRDFEAEVRVSGDGTVFLRSEVIGDYTQLVPAEAIAGLGRTDVTDLKFFCGNTSRENWSNQFHVDVWAAIKRTYRRDLKLKKGNLFTYVKVLEFLVNHKQDSKERVVETMRARTSRRRS